MGKMQDLSFGDLILDETCLFARRNGITIQFTRSERALLLAFSRNPRRLMPRSRLLDEIASPESDPSDRNVDFLVNRLRTKLGDNAKSPMYIATQYGEGYVWIAEPSVVPVTTPRLAPVHGLLAIAPAFAAQDDRFSQQASSLVGRLRDMIADSVGAGQKVVVVDHWRDAAADGQRYVLQVSFQADPGRLDCTATLREMPSKQIMKAFRLDLDSTDATSFTREATRVSHGVADALRLALTDASTGLGTPSDLPLDMRLHTASTLLSSSNPKWLEKGLELSAERAQHPANADIALQWCLHLFARLVANPFTGISQNERADLESEIEATVLECLPVIEANPLLMLAAAKLLYFVNRGHLELAEDLAERAFARTADFAAALPVLGQLRQARGKFSEAVIFFDRGIEMAEPNSAFLLHMQVMKCIALLACGDRTALDAMAATFSLDSPYCPPDIAVMIRLMMAQGDRTLPAALTDALAEVGPTGARNAIAYLYFTSARHLTSETARANVMRGFLAQVTSLYGAQAIPAFVLAGTGLVAAT
jgi:DNA-binding winged helix-turn-helix (wHTH) protein/tetratricopeptide (TPR) repeat protein